MVRDSSEVGVWKVIGKQWDFFKTKISFAVSNGKKVKFWKDRWCSEEPLCETFLSLFALFDLKEAWRFLSKLQGQTMKRVEEDKVVWKGDNKGVFSIEDIRLGELLFLVFFGQFGRKEIGDALNKINAINAQYQDQLGALRARHANRRDEFLRRESHARQSQYQQAAMDHFSNSSMGPSDPHGYDRVEEQRRAYNADHFDSYRERARFLGGARDHGFEPRGQYPGGRVYDTGSRYY
ncbi:hypothetical protein CK203_049514 [Vitis vinifera]|uniref:Uncharacterized protein n=1 Tax=Vitis vinifera TaxID=29760 RepID=A0A438HBC1_VITVI|nr:hypothetical protein CK203_049514 [Vitis vinifera]